MNSDQMTGFRSAPVDPPEVCLWRGLRQRLQGVASAAGKDGMIYINGKTFAVEHFQFVIDNFQPPKPAKARK